MEGKELKRMQRIEHKGLITFADLIGALSKLELKESVSKGETFDVDAKRPDIQRNVDAAKYIKDLAELLMDTEDEDSFRFIDGIAASVVVFELYWSDSEKANDMAREIYENGCDNNILPWPYGSDDDDDDEEDDDDDDEEDEEYDNDDSDEDDDNDDSIQIKNGVEELNSLIGLSEVKQEITSLTNYIRLNNARKERGMPTQSISYHLVFTGNPGTGKTTVARLLAHIFKELGILKKGHLVETDRSGLVAEYVGQTAVKTNKIIDKALDGVLFIDEAYTLSQGDGQDYGHEAIATLLKRMEDDRSRLIVILAGYGDEMKNFIDSNPGLRSRFTRYINFPDYSPDELYQIMQTYLVKQQYSLSDKARQILRSYLNDVFETKQKDFGNARFVRNLFERIIQQQANRFSSSEVLTDEQLQLITEADVEGGIMKMI